MKLSIEIVSDFVCPWCFLGTERLHQALAERPDVNAELRFTPFLLDPSIPPEGRDLRAHLRAKYGADPEAMFPRVEGAARASGITLDFSTIRRFPPTLPAHVVAAAAPPEQQPALARAIFRAYFQEGEDISQADVLERLAVAHGLAPGRATELLADPAALDRASEIASAQVRRGIRGVPFFVLGGRHGLSGAQEKATWLEVLTRLAPRTADATA